MSYGKIIRSADDLTDKEVMNLMEVPSNAKKYELALSLRAVLMGSRRGVECALIENEKVFRGDVQERYREITMGANCKSDIG